MANISYNEEYSVICELLTDFAICIVIFLFIVLPILSVILIVCFITYVYGAVVGVTALIIGVAILTIYFRWLKSERKK